MHSFMNRGNTLLTFFGTVAAAVCVLTALTDVIHPSNPDVNIGLHEVKKLIRNGQSGQDQAIVTFNLTADLRSAFSWNTKQLFVFMQAEYLTPENKLNHVVLWDSIIQSKEQAVVRLRKHKTKYAFIDQARGLRGTPLKLSLHWDIMPYVGYFQIHSKSFDVGKLPATYT